MTWITLVLCISFILSISRYKSNEFLLCLLHPHSPIKSFHTMRFEISFGNTLLLSYRILLFFKKETEKIVMLNFMLLFFVWLFCFKPYKKLSCPLPRIRRFQGLIGFEAKVNGLKKFSRGLCLCNETIRFGKCESGFKKFGASPWAAIY